MYISTRSVLVALSFFLSLHSNAQDLQKKWEYQFGAGPAIEGNLGMWGIHFTNQFSYYLSDRVSINPSLTYFSSIADIDNIHRDEKAYRQDDASDLFANVKIQADILNTTRGFQIGLAAGPSFQLGGTSYHRGFTMDGDQNIVSMGYEVEKHQRLGYVTEINFGWNTPNPNIKSSAALSMSSFSGYWPYYLMATYKIGFLIK